MSNKDKNHSSDTSKDSTSKPKKDKATSGGGKDENNGGKPASELKGGK